ncbi:MAG: EAL domain-containing protein [Alphaproteobacteria bacterium]|nr:EAL domain-containing protein [Alphaproteobacteria bacterium]
MSGLLNQPTIKERLLAFSFVNADVLIEVGEDWRVQYVSGATQSLLGAPPGRILGTQLTDWIARVDQVMVTAALTKLADAARMNPVLIQVQGEGAQPLVLAGYRMDQGHRCYYLTLSRAAVWPTARQLIDQRDPATGLLNADAFSAAVAQNATVMQKTGGDSKLTFITFANLEQARLRMGNGNAAMALNEIAGLLRAQSIDGATAGRLGEDRFGVLHRPEVRAEDIRLDVSEISRAKDPAREGFEVSHATVEVPSRQLSNDDAAKVLIYTIKRFSECAPEDFRIASLADGMQSMMAETVSRVTRLRETVQSPDLKIALQPIVMLSSRKVHHYEALARPAGGQSPAEVVGFAELIGMVQDFDLMVCRRVVELIQNAEARNAPVQIAVNISAASLESDIFIGSFRKMMAPLGRLRRNLLLEITESMQIRDLEAAERILQQFRADGHRICLDDFGAGAASFQYLQALSVEFVKIDGNYIHRISEGRREQAILKAISGLCRDLSIGTIAEMIEQNVQAERLLELGIDFGQGYLFGRPSTEHGLDSASQAKSDRPAARNARRQGYAETWA